MSAKERFIDKTIYDITRNTDDTVYIFSKPHNDMYITAYRIYIDNKFFGVGPRQFRNTCDQYSVSKYSCETHPHNTYLQLLSETGFLGTAFLVFIYLMIVYRSIINFFKV